MATRKVKLVGAAQWAKIFEENRDTEGFEGAFRAHDGATTIDIVLSDSEFAKLKAAGSIKKGTKTEDGDTKVKLTRKWTDRFEWASGAPKVTDAEGETLTYADGIIPNNSIVEVEVSVYDTSYTNRCGTRLESVKVLHRAEMPDPEPEGEKEEKELDEVPF